MGNPDGRPGHPPVQGTRRQRVLGHTSLNTTKMYIDLIDDENPKEVFQQYSLRDALRL